MKKLRPPKMGRFVSLETEASVAVRRFLARHLHARGGTLQLGQVAI